MPVFLNPWACPAETTTTVIYQGYIYQTMSGLDKTAGNGACEQNVALPAGFALVDYDADIVTNVVRPYGWGVNLIQFGDHDDHWTIYHTSNFGQDQTFENQYSYINHGDGTYSVGACTWAFLVRKSCDGTVAFFKMKLYMWLDFLMGNVLVSLCKGKGFTH